MGTAKGEAVNTAKLKVADVIEIRHLARSGVPIARIHDRFPDVKHETISFAACGRTWTSLPGAVPKTEIRRAFPVGWNRRDFFQVQAERIAVGGPDDCWPWLGTRTEGGYGVVIIDGVSTYTHRLAFEADAGRALEDGEVVRHSCDNPPCCNPGHLAAGTQADNVNDMMARGRHVVPRGEAAPQSILTEADVLEIRRLAAEGASVTGLSKLFPVSTSTIKAVATGQKWKHLPGAVQALAIDPAAKRTNYR